MVAHFQSWIIVNERGLKIVDSDSVDAALFTIQFDPVQVDHSWENGQLNKALWRQTERMELNAKSSLSHYLDIIAWNQS